ncbi:E3 ubiquitin-protein ligase TRIM63-like isoform X2 [Eucyclogobius newberryi]|uniref:E3 ubiquitin-protein ligase TRIM63-like isoform X2 n=1 Tax=Eucyclogobius newberryi TaxID=166745 RepID=UPI003B5C45C5
MDSLEKQLVCPICLEMFQKPVVILPCQHNLCRKCANDVFQASNPYLSTRSSSGVSSGGRFRCPSCRHEVVLDRHGVYGLQRNLLVENIIDMYKQGGASKPSEPPQPEVPMCEEHPDEKINIYCISCGAPTCSMCKVFGAHKDCEVAPLHTVFSTHKAELTDCISLLVGNNERTQAIISHFEETSRTVNENSRWQKSHVCELLDRLFSLLEQKKLSLTQKISSEQEEKQEYLRGLRAKYKQHLEQSASTLQEALQALEQEDHALFLQEAKPLLQKITEGTNTSHLDKVQRGYENMDHYSVNFDPQKRALTSISFSRYDEDSEEEEEEAELRATTGSRAEPLPVAAAGPSPPPPAPPSVSPPAQSATSAPPSISPSVPPLIPPSLSPSVPPLIPPSLSPSLPPPLLPAVPPVSFPPLPSQRAAEATPTPTRSHTPSASAASGPAPLASEPSDSDDARHVFSFSWLNKE